MSGRPWVHDGSLESLFLLAHRALSEGCFARPLLRRGGVGEGPGLFDGLCDEPSPPPTAAAAEAASEAARLLMLRSPTLHDLCLEAWMSEERVEAELLAVAAEVGRSGDRAVEDYSRPELRALRAACRRVEREADRLRGFARFAPRGDGLYAAAMEPDHNVLAALLPHFSRRFGDLPFALVDLRRAIAYVVRGGSIDALAGPEALALAPKGPGDPDEELWRGYFAAAENPARRDPALQRRLMPARYWRHLPEMGPPAGDEPSAGPGPCRTLSR